MLVNVKIGRKTLIVHVGRTDALTAKARNYKRTGRTGNAVCMLWWVGPVSVVRIRR